MIKQIDTNADGFLSTAEWDQLAEFRIILKWKVQLEQAGDPKVFEFTVSSSDRNCPSAKHTFVFHVHKCRYCINEGESLQVIAAHFSSSSSIPMSPHWSLLWSLNHKLEAPDKVEVGQEVLIGLVYSARQSDTWGLLASRFGITLDLLMKLNPDLVNSPQWAHVTSLMAIKEGTHVCVMPDTCAARRKPTEVVLW
jgi:hypothetical protein